MTIELYRALDDILHDIDSYEDDEITARRKLAIAYEGGLHWLAAYDLPQEYRGLKDLANLAGDADLSEEEAQEIIGELRSAHRRLAPPDKAS